MTIRDSWIELRGQVLDLIARIDKMVEWIDSCSKVAAGVPAGEVIVPPVPPPPQIVPKPRPAEEHKAAKIIATCWLNAEDERTETSGAYGDQFPPGAGKMLAACSLPWRISGPAKVSVAYKGRRVEGLAVLDVGPWSTTDPFLLESRRPRAEALKGQRVRWDGKNWMADPAGTKTCNGAGIDLTPLVWAQLLDRPVDDVYQQSPSGEVDIVLTLDEPDAHAGPSPHFTWDEVGRSATATEKGVDNTVPTSLRPGVVEFAQGIVEPLRTALGRPMRHGVDWLSWYRSPAVNAAVGGAETSDHLRGRGLDVPRTDEMWKAIRAARVTIPVHLNVEPDHYDIKIGEVPGTLGVSWIKGAVKAAWEV